MSVSSKHNIYFIGIGGIGMSALARYFNANGYRIAGYDKTQTELTQVLEAEGMAIHYEDAMALIPSPFLDPITTLVVYTPAIPKDHAELGYFRSHNFEVLKRSEVLGRITQSTYCMAVAGTHGKTTTTSILGHLLLACDVKLTAFLGGISENYNSNLILNGNAVTVVEADEFDRSFLTLEPDMACITSMDADHLDIYGSAQELKKSFEAFAGKLKEKGSLFVKKGLQLEGITFGVEEEADYTATNIVIEQGHYRFDLKTPTSTIQDIVYTLPGRHNLSNAVAAMAMAIAYGCEVTQLKEALANYQGVKRRFTYHIKSDTLVLIDDYAHHPEEIHAVHAAVREMYPDQKVLAVFQPHLYSRTQDFADEFAASLSQFDEVILLDIYPARELPIPGITSRWLLEKISNPNKHLVTKEALVAHIQNSDATVVLTIGAGDIGDEVKTIKQQLSFAS